MLKPGTAELAYSVHFEPPRLLTDPLPTAFASARAVFGLQQVEEEILLLLLAAHLEPRYGRLYGVLQDDTAHGSTLERLLLTALGRTPGRARAILTTLAESGTLAGAGLVKFQPGHYSPMGRPVELAPEVRDALLELPLPTSLGEVEIEWIDSTSQDEAFTETPLVVVHGAGDRVELAIRQAGASHSKVALICSFDRVELATARSWWRVAALRGALLVLDLSRCEAAVATAAAADLLRLCRRYGGRAVVLCEGPQPLPVSHLEAPALTFVQRRKAWLTEAAARGVNLDAASAARLAANHRLGGRQVSDAFLGARGDDLNSLSEAASRLAQSPIRHGHAVKARRTFDDLVIRDTTRAALERVIYFVRRRDEVAEERGLSERFRVRSGPVLLFSGRSGTGKTLAAEVLAHEVGRPLHVVDLSRLVSKYIGETEKNIDEVLTAGERSNAVLFFDEADSLFSARTEVSSSNDRYANLEVGFLLQRIERHDGVVILATNLQTSIDDAFLRRFHTRVEFPFPETEERCRIWELMLPPGVVRAGNLDLGRLAHAHRLAGGDIRNAALKAIFLAEEERSDLGQEHLERAVALELYELGRLSRRPNPECSNNDAGARLRRLTEVLHESLEGHLRRRFFKEIHIVHGSPTKETLAGKRPAVSVALYRLAAGKGDAIRLGFIVSAWSNRAEEEHELLGVLHGLFASNLLSEVDGRRAAVRVQESYDFDLLQRFWSSHGHPVRASLVLDVQLA